LPLKFSRPASWAQTGRNLGAFLPPFEPKEQRQIVAHKEQLHTTDAEQPPIEFSLPNHGHFFAFLLFGDEVVEKLHELSLA